MMIRRYLMRYRKDGRKVADLRVKTESHNSYPIGINQVRHLVSFPRNVYYVKLITGYTFEVNNLESLRLDA